MKKQVFKAYHQKQAMLLPPDLESLIPEGHLVRVVNDLVDDLDLGILLAQYKGGGTSAYHPKMLLKVLVYAYSQRTFSLREIAKALWENVNYMWLRTNMLTYQQKSSYDEAVVALAKLRIDITSFHAQVSYIFLRGEYDKNT